VVRLDLRQVLFFEAYDHVSAFDLHRASDHLARFKAAFQDMVTGEQPLRQGALEQERT
jgi:quinol monooxygenase YgiN